MNEGRQGALEDRICLAYPKLSMGEAHDRALSCHGLTAYRCPFGGGHHWHSEALDAQALIDMAELLRDRHAGV
jgi:hypothetical protein